MSDARPVFRRVPADMFAFTTTERADLHTAVMQVFGEAAERLRAVLTFDEVLAGLPEIGWYEPVSDESLEYTLGALHKHGLIERTQNHAAHYASAAEYERRNLHYALSRKGEAAYQGVLHAIGRLEESGALQTAVLDAIAARLGELDLLLTDESADDRRVHAALAELEGHLQGLRSGVVRFHGDLQSLLRDEGADAATFQEVKQATIAYLTDFVTDLDARRHTIADAVARIDRHGVAALHARALRGADLPTLPGQADPAPRFLEQRAARWTGLRDWFLPADGARARADDLADMARRAIVELMRALERLSESRRRGSGTASDFRTLARWFSAAETDEAAHELWAAATGLWSARHTHLAPDDPTAVGPGTSWFAAPGVHVSPLLRTHGQSDRAARTARVRDTTEIREQRRQRAQRERLELEEAWSRLATPGPVRLSSFARLDQGSFSRLLELLARALTVPARGGERRASTADGRLVVTLLPPPDHHLAYLRTARGVLVAPDFIVSISESRPGQAAPVPLRPDFRREATA
ncbi:TIGR02677 family protein [Catenuloplanes sp. NPDC051500]|uniref:TIGR02677 family protein n=1 Tax=Catenuloplanes sp. NPDC051500 TaxID=3363959 RepID=UPI0037B32B6B